MRISFLFLLLNALLFTQILTAADDDAQLKSALLKAIDAHDTPKVQALADGGHESIDRDDALQEKIYLYFEGEKERALLAKDQAKTDAVAKKAADEKMKADAAAMKAAEEKAQADAAAKKKAQQKANADAAAAKKAADLKAADAKAATAKKAADQKAAAAKAKAAPAAGTAAVSAAALSAAAAKKAADEKAKADALAAKKAADEKAAASALAAKKAADEKKRNEEMLAAKKAADKKAAADALAAKTAADEKIRLDAAAAKAQADAEAKRAAEAAPKAVIAAPVVAVPAAAAVKESFNAPLTISDKKLIGMWKQVGSDKVSTLSVDKDGKFTLEEVEDDGTLTLKGTWRSDKNIFMLSIKKVQRNIHSRETNIHRIYKVEELSDYRLVLSDQRDRIAYDLKR